MGRIQSFGGVFRAIADDLDHFRRVRGARTPGERARVAFEWRLWCLAVHRFGQWVYGPQPGRLRPLLKLVFHALDAVARLVGRCQIEVIADIGARCFLAPYGSLFIAGPVGDDVTFHGDVTVGWGGRGLKSGVARVGSRVSLGPGAVVAGPVQVSDGASVGANGVAVSDLSQAGYYAGAPAVRLDEPSPERIVPSWSREPRGPQDEEEPMDREEFWAPFRRDLARYLPPRPGGRAPIWSVLRTAATTPGVWACFVYRLRRSLATGPSWSRDLLLLATWPLEVAVKLAAGITLDRRAQIGAGFFIGHFGSIHVGPGVRIGEGCNIGQNCFVGPAAAGAPRVGDRVYIGVGAKIVGPFGVGDGAAIGANAVVLADVPPMAVVVGNPARVVGGQGSTGLLEPLFHEGPGASGSPGSG